MINILLKKMICVCKENRLILVNYLYDRKIKIFVSEKLLFKILKRDLY